MKKVPNMATVSKSNKPVGIPKSIDSKQTKISRNIAEKETVEDRLPPGFRRVRVMRTSGDSVGKYDYYIYK